MSSANQFLIELQQLAAANPNDCIITIADDLDLTYYQDWRQAFCQKPLCMVQPKSTKALQKIVQLAQYYQQKIVTQGGNTSLCGGAVPAAQSPQVTTQYIKPLAILLNLNLMNQIIEFNPVSKTLVVEAGCTLADVQAFAKKQGLLYPLSLPSQQQCTIGGNLSTNAGGVAVLRYGNSRQLCLGIEVVLADGSIYHGLKHLVKNNFGYDLKHYFIGAEGTLGIITAATLQLYEKPSEQYAYALGCDNLYEALRIFSLLKQAFSPLLTSFEIINHEALLCVEKYQQKYHKNFKFPLGMNTPWLIICEISCYEMAAFSQDLFLQQLAAHGIKLISTVGIDLPQKKEIESANNQNLENESSEPPNEMQMPVIWQIRHQIPLAQKMLGGNIKHDISVKIDDIAEFSEKAQNAILAEFANAELIIFGHMGDGNLHFNVRLENVSLSEKARVSEIIYDIVEMFDGSLAAEHGVGQLKKSLLAKHLPANHLLMMKAIKNALDPNNLFNPDVMFLDH